MTVIGTLEGLRPSEHALGTAINPTRSSGTSLLLTRETSDAKRLTKLHECIVSDAKAALATAHRNARVVLLTTLATLAQAHLRLGNLDEARESARQSLMYSVDRTAAGDHPAIIDSAAVRVACEVMIRLDQSREAYEILADAQLPLALRLVVATLANNLGESGSAARLVEPLDDPLAESSGIPASRVWRIPAGDPAPQGGVARRAEGCGRPPQPFD